MAAPSRASSWTPFTLTVAGKAPHPNATRVFANWLATREAVEIYSRGDDVATLRTDVDESFLDPAAVPRLAVQLWWQCVSGNFLCGDRLRCHSDRYL